MEPLSPFVQHYEFLCFSCSHFKAINKSKIVSKRQQEGNPGEEEKSGGETEADDFGTEERKSISDAGFGCIKQPGDSRNAMLEFTPFWHWETSRERCKRCE